LLGAHDTPALVPVFGGHGEAFSRAGICVFKSFIQSMIHLFAGFLKRAFRIDGVFHFFDRFVDMLTGLFRRPLFPAGND